MIFFTDFFLFRDKFIDLYDVKSTSKGVLMNTQDIMRVIRREIVLYLKAMGKSMLNSKDVLLCKYHLIMIKLNFNTKSVFYHCDRFIYRTKRIEERIDEMTGYCSEIRYMLDMLYEEIR